MEKENSIPTWWKIAFAAVAAFALALAWVGLSAPPCAFAAGTCPVGEDASFSGDVILESGTAFETTLSASTSTANRFVYLPDATDTLVGLATTDTLTNKTLGATVLTGNMTVDSDSSYNLGASGARMATVFTDTVGDSGQDLTVNSTGILQPNAPMVLAHNGASDTNVTGDGTVVTVDYDTEIMDRGSDFASDTFTAPVTGLYLICAWVLVGDAVAAHNTGQVEIVTSNRSYRTATNNPGAVISAGNRLTMGGCVHADMDAADTATVELTVSGSTKVVDVISSIATMISISLVG